MDPEREGGLLQRSSRGGAITALSPDGPAFKWVKQTVHMNEKLPRLYCSKVVGLRGQKIIKFIEFDLLSYVADQSIEIN